MTKRRIRTWAWFLANALVLLAALSWLTATLVSVDREEVASRAQARTHESVRLALWRMDSWLSPQISREAMRPAVEYRAYAPAREAWTRGFNKLPPDEVLTASPLLAFRSPIFRLHFEVAPDGTVTSPQVPAGNERDVAEDNGTTGAAIDACAKVLEALRPRLRRAALEPGIAGAEEQLPPLGCGLPLQGALTGESQGAMRYTNRQLALNAPRAHPAAAVGPLVPVWLRDEGEPLLVFARRVRDAGALRLQGVVADWAELEKALLGLVPDLFEAGQAELVRCISPGPREQATMLATVPARLVVRPGRLPLASTLPTTAILAITWGMALLALAILGFTLRAAIGYGERRARFASAVTHELRTPLTTFRMYSEMLADGVVKEPQAQREYLETLRTESDRLARVVENVLGWARLEEGRFATRRDVVDVGALCERVLPPLQRRARDAGMELRLDLPDALRSLRISTDEDAVGQILFNLVDNAAKHARSAQDRGIELAVSDAGGRVHLHVRDHGPGVPGPHRGRIFAPFDRGPVPTASNDVPGVGLGLALARGLARDLGGDLILDASVTDGACFVLELPAGPR